MTGWTTPTPPEAAALGQESTGVRLNRRIKAYAGIHRCELAADGLTLPARLIDINAASARIRLEAPPGRALRLDQRALLHARFTASGRRLDDLPCRVAWTMGPEAGLEFEIHLGLGILDLQRALDPGRAA